MSRFTYFVVIPFVRSPKGDGVLAIDAEEAASRNLAEFKAAALIGHKRGPDTVVGAVAFSRTVDPDEGVYADAVILARYGEIPDDLQVSKDAATL